MRYLSLRLAIRLMIQGGIEGAIVNIGSMSEHAGQPFISAYCASKGALAAIEAAGGKVDMPVAEVKADA